MGGIGGGTAIALAAASPRLLILISRDLARVQPVIDSIKASHPTSATAFVGCNLSSQVSIRAAASSIADLVPHIDKLINNAAIPPGPYTQTPDGIESQFGTNHIGHFLLTNLLLPRLLAAPPGARVVNVSSSAHRYATHLFDDYNFSNGATYSEREGYVQSKAANILFTKALAQKLTAHDVQSFALHPGSIDTGLNANIPPEVMAEALRKAKEMAASEGREYVRSPRKTIQQGCSTTLVAALDPALSGQSGAYLEDGRISEKPPSVLATDTGNAAMLWKLSEDLVGQEFDWV